MHVISLLAWGPWLVLFSMVTALVLALIQKRWMLALTVVGMAGAMATVSYFVIVAAAMGGGI